MKGEQIMSSMNWQYSEAAKCGKHSKQQSSGSFYTGGSHHDTYANQEAYVKSLGNKWAEENFNATRPYFA